MGIVAGVIPIGKMGQKKRDPKVPFLKITTELISRVCLQL